MAKLIAGLMAVVVCVSVATAAPVTGRVLTPDGLPAVDARVRLFYCHEPNGHGCCWVAATRTGEGGAFQIDRPAFTPPEAFLSDRPVRVTYLVAEQQGATPAIVALTEEDTGEHLLALRPGRTVRCTVLDAEGKPVAGLPVLCDGYAKERRRSVAGFETPEEAGMGCLWRHLVRAQTGADGVASLEGLPARAINLKCGAGVEGTASAVAKENAHTIGLSLTGQATQFRCSVTMAGTRQPVPGVLVSVHADHSFYEPNEPLAWGRTTATGQCDLSVPPRVIVRGGRPQVIRRRRLTVLAQQTDADARCGPVCVEAEEAPGQTVPVDLSLSAGRSVSARVVDSVFANPLPGAIMRAKIKASVMGFAYVYRGCDAEGGYRVCLGESCSALQASGAPPGFLVAGRNIPEVSNRTILFAGSDLVLPVAPLGGMTLALRDPTGKPLARAYVTVLQRGTRRMAETDEKGLARLNGLPGDRASLVYARTRDNRLAVRFTVPPLKTASEAPIERQLAPTRTGRVLLREVGGQALRGSVSISMISADGRDTMTVAQGRTVAGALEVGAPVAGLLPGVSYSVSAFVPGGQPVYGLAPEWHVKPDDPEPTITLRFRAQQQPPVPERRPKSAPVERTVADFQRELNALKTAAWRKKDTVEAHLVWYAVGPGVALVDTHAETVRRFPNLMGYAKLSVSGIAFGAKRVWLATDKGLLAWHRRLCGWNRFAVEGVLMEPNVVGLALENDVLRVTIEDDSGRRRTCTLGLADERWRTSGVGR